MELSSEDTLKLNVLLANAEAIRINESAMCIYGLRGEHEAKVQLNPNCKPERYIKLVREMLSTLVLGSPKGYPVYLRRWTRMGEMQTTRLEPLLKLGEEEAMIAVARAPGLTNELARRIWWALPDPNIARYMLSNPTVVNGTMGPKLAEFLVEFLPFEDSSQSVVHTVSLVLQAGLISAETKRQIWQRGIRKNQFYIGFLYTVPDDLPEQAPAHPNHSELSEQLIQLQADPVAGHFLKLLDSKGQSFLATCAKVLQKPADQDVVVSLLDAMWSYMTPAREQNIQFDDIEELQNHIELAFLLVDDQPVSELIRGLPEHRKLIEAFLILAHAGEPLVRPIFSRTDAVGTVMRKRIEHITTPLLNAIADLRG